MVDVVKISKSFGFGKVITDLSFSAFKGNRVALVGKNGCGKSTVLNIIDGKVSADSGNVIFAKNTKVGFLEQTAPDRHDNRLVSQIFRAAFEHLDKYQQGLFELENKMSASSDDELIRLVEKYSNMQENFMQMGGYEIENTINYVVNGLKLTALLDRCYDTLSSGEKTLVHFARILLEQPHLLLLDEPTNHLDIERIEWLESYLQRFAGAVIIVTHDRYFLDRVAKTVIDLEDGGEKYEGNYSYFVKEKENKILREFEQFKNEQKKIAELEKAVKRLYEWGKQSDNPDLFRRAKAIQKRVDVLKANAIDKPTTRRELPIAFGGGNRSGQEVIKVQDMSITLGDKNILDNVNMSIYFGDKVALVGKNGSGKSTLIKCIMQEICEYSGLAKVGANVKIGYLSQILSFENESESILEFITNNTNLDSENARRLLTKYEFTRKDFDKKISKLSGGEKIRIKIAVMLVHDVNTLIFDEPTNHIDIFTRETLEEAMNNFKGTILFVSHDRYFIDSIASKVIEIDSQKLKLYEGNYSDYKRASAPIIEKRETNQAPKAQNKKPKIRKT